MTRTQQIAIAAVAGVAALAAYWMLALSPKREEATKLGDSIAKQQQTLQTSQAELAKNLKAKESFKANYATVARLGKAVPEADDVRSLVVQLDSAAKRSKVDFRTIQVGVNGGASNAATPAAATVGSAGFVTMPFQFTFSGHFFRLGDFFSRLERFVAVNNQRIDVTGRLLQLDSIDLKPDGSGFPNIAASIAATSYLLPPSQGLTAGASVNGPAAPAAAGTTPADAAKSAVTPPTVPSAIITGAK